MSKNNTATAAEHFELGRRYALGDGVPKDDKKAFECYTKAAEQGYADAQNKLGDWYSSGFGITNFRIAAEWYEKAAEQGHTGAQFSLGGLYKSGYSVNRNSFEDIHNPATDIQKNLDLAIKWFRKAAEGGYITQGGLSAEYFLNDCLAQKTK